MKIFRAIYLAGFVIFLISGILFGFRGIWLWAAWACFIILIAEVGTYLSTRNK